MTYTVVWTNAARKQLHKLDPQTRRGIMLAVTGLEHNPRPPSAKKLVERPEWRLRWRDYRVIYLVADQAITVKVVRVGHRRDVYG